MNPLPSAAPPRSGAWLYPLASGFGLLGWALASTLGLRAELTVLGWGLFIVGLAVWLERHQPYNARWRSPVAGDMRRVDLPSALVVLGVVEPLGKLALPLLALGVAAQAPALGRLWPHEAPWALQWLLALLLSELGKYAMHRAHHAWHPLWRLHALHHGSERLNWLNGLRIHPLNLLLGQLAALLPLRLAGAGEELLPAVLAFTQPVLLLQHANLGLRSGAWNRIFSTHEAHRWHHSARPAEANRNFGAALLFWDHVFGSFLDPEHPARRAAAPARIGLFGNGGGYPARSNYGWQLLSALPRLSWPPRCCAFCCTSSP